MFRTLIASLTVLTAAATLAAGDALEITRPNQLKTGKENIEIRQEPGSPEMRISEPTSLYSKDAIAIDPEKRYRLSGKFRSATPGKTPRISFGVDCRRANKGRIAGPQVNALSGTGTELAEPCAVGDRILKVKDASNWSKGKIPVFLTDPGETYSDLPNSNTDYLTVTAIAPNADNRYDVTLSGPMKRAFPADTPLRLHEMGHWFHFSIADRPLTDEWQTLELEFQGIAPVGSETGKWRKGTRFAGIACYPDPGRDKAAVEFKDLKLEEAK